MRKLVILIHSPTHLLEIARMNLEEFKDVLSRRGIKIKVSVTKGESDKRLKEVFDA